METLISILIVVLIVVAFVASIITLRKEGFTSEGWSKVRKIMYEALEDGLKLYQNKNMTFEELTDLVAQIIYNRISSSDIPQEDKSFWTISRIKYMITPVLQELLEQLEAS